MALPFTPAKRPFDRHPMEPSGRGKWQKTSPSGSLHSQFKILPGSVVFRVLCPSFKSGGVIGKGGGIVAKIRNDTGARIKLEESFPGCDERVVVISGPAKDLESRNERIRQDDADNIGGGGEDGKGNVEGDKEKRDSSISEGSNSMKATSSVQRALFLIFERIMEGETENNNGDEASKNFSPTIRLLVPSSQIGCIMGKGGSTIKQMSTDSGAVIRILSGDQVPPCASPQDEIVQITGGINTVRKALQLVSQQMLDNPPRDRDFLTDNTISRLDSLNPTSYHAPFNRPPFDSSDLSSFSKFHEGPVVPGQMPLGSELLIFRLLCSNEKVGSVIGKGGTIVRNLQNETGCDIKVMDTLIEADDRIIVVSGPALPGDGVSPPQDAVLRVQHRIFKAASETDSLARLLVSSNQIGSLLGKGGAVITEMRRNSGANIRILSKDQNPKGLPGNDEIVQVSGEFGAVQKALTQITARLKSNLFRDRGAAFNHPSHPPFLDPMPPFGPYMGRREPLSPRLYGGIPPFQKDVLARGHEERLAFGHGIQGPGVPPLGLERGPPPAAWAPQGMREGGGPMPISDFGGAPSRRMGGFQGGNQSAPSPQTTVDAVVPRALVPSIYGEDGGCLRRIREISEAKITITESRPDAAETVIIISGTPEQTHAAQSLIQAFVLSETSAP